MKICPCLAVLATLAGLAHAQESGISAKTALSQLSDRFGTGSFTRLVEMKGTQGQSQPAEWWVVAHDSRSEYLLRTFWAGSAGEVTNEGANDAFYTRTRNPPASLSTEKLKIDSTEAFEILDAAANKAKVGFDSVNYLLRCREFSDEPIWTLTALDRDDHVVGIVHISAFRKKVLRSVWFDFSTRTRSGIPVITDSALKRKPAKRQPRPEAQRPIPELTFRRTPQPTPPAALPPLRRETYRYDEPVVEEILPALDVK